MQPLEPPRLGGRELASWKEIASYLGINVRTAQKWEQERGMPVRRLPGGRGRVEAHIDEIEAWRRSAVVTPQPGSLWKRIGVAAAGGALTLSIAAYLLASRKASPVQMRIAVNTLIIADAEGRELWHHTFDHPLRPDVAAVREPSRKRVWFGDLDDDGKIETLFVDMPAEDGSRSEVLICFSEGGSEKWRFNPGRTVRTRSHTFEPPYDVADFVVAAMGRNRPKTVLVSSSHSMMYPNQIVLLTTDGKMLREYWHSGHLNFVRLADLDNDGVNEIYLGGTSNARKAATLVVLDPDRFAGTSQEENPDYQFLDFPPGKERARLLFPRSCVNRKYEAFNSVESLWCQTNTIKLSVLERFNNSSGPVAFYELTRDLKLKDWDFSGPLRALHTELESTHQLDHHLSERELAEMRNIRYLPAN
jgi:hypothetical protein